MHKDTEHLLQSGCLLILIPKSTSNLRKFSFKVQRRRNFLYFLHQKTPIDFRSFFFLSLLACFNFVGFFPVIKVKQVWRRTWRGNLFYFSLQHICSGFLSSAKGLVGGGRGREGLEEEIKKKSFKRFRAGIKSADRECELAVYLFGSLFFPQVRYASNSGNETSNHVAIYS